MRLLTGALLLGLLGAAVLPTFTPPAFAVEETSGLESLLPTSERRAPSTTSPSTSPSAGRSIDAGAAPGAGALTPPGPENAPALTSQAGGWSRLKEFPLIRRVRSVGAWVGCLVRFVVSIPKAIFKGDSRGMISALGDLLSRSSRQPDTPAPANSHGEETETPRGPTNFSIQ